MLYGSVGFFVAAVSGVLLNLAITWGYGPKALGVFNQVYAIYILAGQLAAFGIHQSVGRWSAIASNGRTRLELLAVGCFICLILGCVIGGSVWSVGLFLGELFQSQAVGQWLQIAALGLPLFAVNKTLLAYANGRSMFRRFAVISSCRALFLVMVCGYLMFRKVENLAYVFPIVEFLLFLLTGSLLVYSGRHLSKARKTKMSRLLVWSRRHFAFGRKAFVGGLLSEANTRVDVICLGLLSSDLAVGIYSFGAMWAEGIFQFGVVYRRFIVPRIAKFSVGREADGFMEFIKKWKRLSGVSIIVLSCGVAVAFPVIEMLLSRQEMDGAFECLLILVGFLCLIGAYIPFFQFFNSFGRPGLQTLFTGGVVLMNSILNVCLIPSFGIYGAAVGTGVSWLVSVLCLKVMVLKFCKVAI